MSEIKYNVGKVRKFLMVPFNCKWNAWVRDTTAWVERKLKEKS